LIEEEAEGPWHRIGRNRAAYWGSSGGDVVSPLWGRRCSSKAAVVSLARSFAIELSDAQISVNAVAPGWVDTPGTRAGGRLEQAVATIPFRRAAQPTEIADWVWMLAQGTYMTGETVVISGGLIVR
jgi:3-oxoacyl-[acyl-carrier protein] reductase